MDKLYDFFEYLEGTDWAQFDEESTEEHVDEICEMAEGKLKKTPLITEPQWIEKLNPKENDNG